MAPSATPVASRLLCGWFSAALIFAGCASDETERNEALARERANQIVAETPVRADYLLQPGDLLSIKFFYTPELNQQAPIRPDGKLSLQLIGEVAAADHTVAQLRDELVERYSATMKHPEIAVIVDSIDSQKVYVGGEVLRGGVIPSHPGMTAMQAIFAAGGCKNTAELANVVILRYQGTPQPLFLMLDLQEGLSSYHSMNDLVLNPRDIVFVPMSKIATVNQFVDQYIDKVLPFSRSLNVQYTFGQVGVTN